VGATLKKYVLHRLIGYGTYGLVVLVEEWRDNSSHGYRALKMMSTNPYRKLTKLLVAEIHTTVSIQERRSAGSDELRRRMTMVYEIILVCKGCARP